MTDSHKIQPNSRFAKEIYSTESTQLHDLNQVVQNIFQRAI